MKTVYTCFCTDTIHEGHLNIINEAKKYGEVIVGVLTDEAMISFNSYLLKSFEERIEMVRQIPGLYKVITQRKPMYDEVIGQYKPDYVIHGDNWCDGIMKYIRDDVERLLSSYGGKIIDVPYTYNDEVHRIDAIEKEKLSMPEFRRGQLRRRMEIRGLVKALEVHNGLTGLIAEKTVVAHKGEMDQFDAMWISSLCDSTAKGKPDIELVDMTSRFRTIEDVMEVTTKPIIFDGDTGGQAEHFVYTVRTLERMGVSAVIIEDKIGLKKNSLFGTAVKQEQDNIEHFCEKIRAGKRIQLSEDFMIIARVESLILEKGVNDALERAFAYVYAGADGIMIHSKSTVPDEVLGFCDRFREKDNKTPLVVVPTAFSSIKEEMLKQHGVNIVIYANQLTRSAFPAMVSTAQDILRYHRAKEVEGRMMPIGDIISLIDEL